MNSIAKIIDHLEKNEISVFNVEEERILVGYELNTYTSLGVNQIIFIDFRNTKLKPKNAKDFLKLYNERIESIDIDDEIEMNRQDERFRISFSLSDSIKDFKDWKQKLSDMFKGLTEKRISLPFGGIEVQVMYEGGVAVGGSISDSDLKTEHDDEEDELYNSAMDGITSLILAHAILGIDIESDAYVEGIRQAVDACAQNT